MHHRISLILAAGGLLLLTGCNSKTDSVCPTAAALVEASNMTGFAAGATPDPAHALYRIAISNVTTDCDIDAKARTADSSLDIHFVATRAPTGAPATYRVPYFVAVHTGGSVQGKKVYWTSFHFAPGASSTSFDVSVDSTTVKIANDKQPFDYQLLVGFQLTRKELEYNRKSGHYGP